VGRLATQHFPPGEDGDVQALAGRAAARRRPSSPGSFARSRQGVFPPTPSMRSIRWRRPGIWQATHGEPRRDREGGRQGIELEKGARPILVIGAAQERACRSISCAAIAPCFARAASRSAHRSFSATTGRVLTSMTHRLRVSGTGEFAAKYAKYLYIYFPRRAGRALADERVVISGGTGSVNVFWQLG